jgi:hypothetical protein
VAATGTQAVQAQQPQAQVDLGIASVTELGSSAGNRSLAQQAATERAGGQKPARTITNQDIQRMNEQTKSGTMGLTPPTQQPGK